MLAHRSSRQYRQRTPAGLAVAVSLAATFTLAAAPAPAGAAARGPSAALAATPGTLPAAAKGAFTPPTRALTPADGLSAAASAQSSPVSYPLHTSGRWIENAQGQRVKLASVNWDGAESAQAVVGGLHNKTIDQIATWIAANGFNSVRVPWSNYMYEHHPVVSTLPACMSHDCLAANPSLKGLDALNILDQVITTLGQHGLAVILDNHNSDAEWCCNTSDHNGLWYNSNYSENSWIADWQGITARYQNNHAVIGAELRNEPRTADGVTPVWGGGSQNDWHRAATEAGDGVLSVNSDWLIFVDGLSYSLDLTGVHNNPVVLNFPNRVVYAPHAYVFSNYGGSTWSGWYTNGLGGQITDTVSAVQYGQQLLLFARGTDGHAYEDQWTEPSGPWSGWQSVQGNMTSAPTAVVYGQQVLLFARGTDSQVYEDAWTPSTTSPPGSWSGWHGIGGSVTGGLSAAAFNNQVQVFGRGPDGQVYADVWTPSTTSPPGSWSGWYTNGIGGQIVGAPTAVAFGQQLLLFARGTDNKVYEDRWQSPGPWSGWSTAGISGQVTSSPVAVAFGQYQVQVFARGTDGAVWDDVWTASTKSPPGSWTGWHSLGGSVTDAPGASAFGPNQMQVFDRGTDGQVYADVWSNQGYQGFAQNIGDRWGYILTQGQSYTAPLWVSEWGTCIQPDSGHCDNNDTTFFSNIVQYLKAGDIDFAYWQLGSEILPGRPAPIPVYDYYGLLNPSWDDWPAQTTASSNVATVKSLEAPTQGP